MAKLREFQNKFKSSRDRGRPHLLETEQFNDWQNNFQNSRDRSQHLLEATKWTDCRFLVGESSNQKLVSGHKLILAMASPVFGRMFYGSFPEKTDPIAITDVEPDVFHTMLEYVYSDKIKISSFDNAWEVYYVAEKYLLLDLVAKCRSYLLESLNPTNACSAYELAKHFDESSLMKSSMDIIVTKTNEVLAGPDFYNIKMTTFLTILDCDKLNIDSELDLFNALSRYASKWNCIPDYGTCTCSKLLTEDKNEQQPIENQPDPKDDTHSTSENHQQQQISSQLIKEAVKKIRFLTLTPEKFAGAPARSKLLSQNDAFSILLKISSADDCLMPEGFSTSRMPRTRSTQQRFGFGNL